MGSGPSQSRHSNLRGPPPPGGSAKVRYAPQSGQVDRRAWPMGLILPPVPKIRQLKTALACELSTNWGTSIGRLQGRIRTVQWTVFIRVPRPVENFKLSDAGAGFHPEQI
jgi:hypothetical protein